MRYIVTSGSILVCHTEDQGKLLKSKHLFAYLYIT